MSVLRIVFRVVHAINRLTYVFPFLQTSVFEFPMSLFGEYEHTHNRTESQSVLSRVSLCSFDLQLICQILLIHLHCFVYVRPTS